MLYADDAGIVAGFTHELARMMTVVVAACQESGQIVSGRKAELVCLWSVPSSAESTLYISAAGKRDQQTARFAWLAGANSADANISVEIDRRISVAGTPPILEFPTQRSTRRRTIVETLAAEGGGGGSSVVRM